MEMTVGLYRVCGGQHRGYRPTRSQRRVCVSDDRRGVQCGAEARVGAVSFEGENRIEQVLREMGAMQ